MDIMLEENPRRRRRRYFNPDFIGFDNPRRRRRKHLSLNPFASVKTLQRAVGGLGWQEIAAGVGGVVAATMLPGRVVKTPDSTLKKLAKLGIGVAAALLAGMGARTLLSQRAGQAAILTGITAVAIQGITSFTSLKIGEGESIGHRLLRGGIGAEVISPSRVLQEEPTGMIMP